MKALAVILALCMGCSVLDAQSICETANVGKNAKCMTSCDGFGTESTQYGLYACIKIKGTKCCIPDEPTTPEPTPEPSTTEEAPSTTTTTVAPPAPSAQCGVKAADDPVLARILFGQDSLACEWPWQVSVRGRTSASALLSPSDDHTLAFCNGVLIDETHVLTTAGCVMLATAAASGDPTGNILVVAGEYDTSKPDFDADFQTTEKVFKLSKVVVHPGFQETDAASFTTDNLIDTTFEKEANNLAVLTLEKPATFSKCVRKVCPPSTNSSCWTSKQCKIAGWGNTGAGFTPSSKLMTADVELIKADVWKVADSLNGGTATLKHLTTYARFTDSSMSNTCMSDNGGMVVCKNEDGKWALEGLVNIPKFEVCEAGDRFLVTDVGAANAWIMEQTKAI